MTPYQVAAAALVCDCLQREDLALAAAQARLVIAAVARLGDDWAEPVAKGDKPPWMAVAEVITICDDGSHLAERTADEAYRAIQHAILSPPGCGSGAAAPRDSAPALHSRPKEVLVRAFELVKLMATDVNHQLPDDAFSLWTRLDLIQRRLGGTQKLISSVDGVVMALGWSRERVGAALRELQAAGVVTELQDGPGPAGAP